MERASRGVVAGLLLAATSTVAAAENEVLRLANWLVGSFDTRAQTVADRANGAAYQHETLLMSARPIEDPVDFADAPYLYVETRVEGEPQPSRQRVYRLKRMGKRIRIEVFMIDSQFLSPLALDPRMLGSLNPGDLVKEEGCDILLDRSGDGYTGSTGPKSCKSDRKGSAYVVSTLRISKDLVVSLEVGYDDKNVQTFGPTDGRGHEFRRVQK